MERRPYRRFTKDDAVTESDRVKEVVKEVGVKSCTDICVRVREPKCGVRPGQTTVSPNILVRGINHPE